MARLPKSTKHTKTALAIFDATAEHIDEWRRAHLGASVLGEECSRRIWYGFRWAVNPWRVLAAKFKANPDDEKHPGQLFSLFGRGHREEPLLIKRMGWAGITIDHWSVDRLRCKPGGHLGGTMDGIGIGFPEAPKTDHVWDSKTANDKQFKIFRKMGLKRWNAKNYGQAQLYMHWSPDNLRRACYTVLNKNDDDIHSDRVPYVKAEATALETKGRQLSVMPEPPERISDDPTWWQCGFCDFHGVCQHGEVEMLERSCRTCAFVTSNPDGTWTCGKTDERLNVDAQKAGCSMHLFIPKLLPWDAEAYDEQGGTITYRRRDGSRVIDTGNDLEARP